jgi:Tfp pilus assembly protein PilF
MPFANFAAWTARLRPLVAGALVLTLAACGSSAPRQADVDAPGDAVAVEPGAAEKPEENRRDRRAERRAAEDANADAAAAVATSAPAHAEEPSRRDRRRAAEQADAAAVALEPVPEAAAAAYTRAVAAMRAENWAEAELELEQLTLEHPVYPGPHVNLALVYLHDGRRDDARTELELALGVDPGHAVANTQLGVLLREDGKFEEAEAAYRRALETNPDHSLAHYNLGVLLDLYLRRPAEALAHYEAYQGTLAEPNETVGRWIIDLRRRVGNGGDAARVAQEARP